MPDSADTLLNELRTRPRPAPAQEADVLTDAEFRQLCTALATARGKESEQLYQLMDASNRYGEQGNSTAALACLRTIAAWTPATPTRVGDLSASTSKPASGLRMTFLP